MNATGTLGKEGSPTDIARTTIHRVEAGGVSVAFRRDNPKAVVQLLDTGHFALETHVEEIALAIQQFLPTSRQSGV